MGEKQSWLLLIHQIPPKPDSFRVKIWRNLQKIGALQLKNSVYVLPANQNHEDRFATLVSEIVEGGGDAFLCRSEFVQGIEPREIVAMFQKDRSDKYDAIAKDLRTLQKTITKTRKPGEDELMSVAHSLGKLARQTQEITDIDFFSAPSKESTRKLLKSIQNQVAKLHGGSSLEQVTRVSEKDFQGKTWVTRARVGVDRMSSAWLVSRFIDKAAKFKFVSGNDYQPKKNEIRFDMFDAEFSHVGDKCTFEVLRESFFLKPKVLETIAEIIHDLDLKDTKFNRPETSGIGLILNGVSEEKITDDDRLQKSGELLDNLFRSLQ